MRSSKTSRACRPGVTLLHAGPGRPVVGTAASKKPLERAVFALAAGVFGALLALSSGTESIAAETRTERVAHADFGTHSPTPVVRKFGDWIVESGDHSGLPFAIIDKINARL